MGRTVKILDYQETAGNNYGQNCTNIKSLTRNSVRYSALCTVLLLVHYYSARVVHCLSAILFCSTILLCLMFVFYPLFCLFCSVRYSALSAIQLCQLFCYVRYSAQSIILFFPPFCSVRYSAISAILFCTIFYSVLPSVLSGILFCPPFCSVQPSVLSAILFSLLFSSVSYSAMSAILLCPLFCSLCY